MLYIAGRHNNPGCMVNPYNELPANRTIRAARLTFDDRFCGRACQTRLLAPGRWRWLFNFSRTQFPRASKGIVGRQRLLYAETSVSLPTAFSKTLNTLQISTLKDCRHRRAGPSHRRPLPIEPKTVYQAARRVATWPSWFQSAFTLSYGTLEVTHHGSSRIHETVGSCPSRELPAHTRLWRGKQAGRLCGGRARHHF